jgi:hypothetical protein
MAEHYLEKKQGNTYHAWGSESSMFSGMYQEDAEPPTPAGGAQQGTCPPTSGLVAIWGLIWCPVLGFEGGDFWAIWRLSRFGAQDAVLGEAAMDLACDSTARRAGGGEDVPDPERRR